MLTSFADDEALFDAIMAGAAGYVLKQVQGARHRRGGPARRRRRVAARPGGDRAGARAAARAAAGGRAPRRPDPQERRILDLLADGLTNRQIAERMFLAEKTVKNYVSNLLMKLEPSHRGRGVRGPAGRPPPTRCRDRVVDEVDVLPSHVRRHRTAHQMSSTIPG